MIVSRWTSGVRFPTLTSALSISALIAVLGTSAWAGGAPLGPPGGPRAGWEQGPPPGAPPGPRPPRPIGPRLDELESLGLSDKQRDAIADLHDDEMRKVIRLDADARLAERDLEKSVLAEHADSLAIGQHAARVASLRAGMLEARVAMLMGLRRVLTPAQWSKLRRSGWDRGHAPVPREP